MVNIRIVILSLDLLFGRVKLVGWIVGGGCCGGIDGCIYIGSRPDLDLGDVLGLDCLYIAGLYR